MRRRSRSPAGRVRIERLVDIGAGNAERQDSRVVDIAAGDMRRDRIGGQRIERMRPPDFERVRVAVATAGPLVLRPALPRQAGRVGDAADRAIAVGAGRFGMDDRDDDIVRLRGRQRDVARRGTGEIRVGLPVDRGAERRAIAGEIEGALEILRPGRQRRHGQDRAEHLAIVRNQNVEIQRRQIVFGRVLRPHGKDGGRNR